MTLSERQYEQIARHLDGQDVAISDQQRQIAEQLLRNEETVGGHLDVELDAVALEAAKRRMLAAMPRGRIISHAFVKGALAAAAMIVLVVAAYWPSRGDRARMELTAEALVYSMQLTGNEDLDILDELIRQIAPGESIFEPVSMDVQIEDIQTELEDYWVDMTNESLQT